MPQITVQGPTGPAVSYRFDQGTITIGRSSANDLVIRDPALSRLHAEIRREGDAWSLADCGSQNGTLLNGRPVREARPLAAGDEIAVGRTTLVFEAEVPEALPEAPARETDRLTWSVRGSGEAAEEPVLIGSSPIVRSVLERVDKVAPSDATVLILGENGTGKELVARLIHRRSPRTAGPFAVVNCPALPGSLLEAELFGVEKGTATGVEPRPGRFETAGGGTVLLDEVGDMDLAAQAKILRVLQDRAVERVGGRTSVPLDVRLLAATHHDLEADIARGAFRRDLYHRLNVVTVTLAPLRDRREDIPLLVEHFLSRPEGPPLRMSGEAMELLMRHDFPGNVRELEHLIERARLLAEGDTILPRDLPEALRGAEVAEPGPPDSEEAAPGGAATEPTDRLYDRVVHGGESFWDVVRGPFLRRELSREEARRLVERAYREGGGSYKGMARLFRIEAQHKKLLNFLRNHGLGVRK